MCCVPVRMIHYITTVTQYSLGWVRVGIGYEMVWVRVGLGTSWHGMTWLGYELTGTRLRYGTLRFGYWTVCCLFVGYWTRGYFQVIGRHRL